MALEMKYFVLKPKGNTPFAAASRSAMLAYAKSIESTDAFMARSLQIWAEAERDQVEAVQPQQGEGGNSAAQTCANCGTDGCSAKGTDKTPNGCDEWRALPSGEHNTGSPKLLALADYALNALQRADYAACGDFINNLRKQLRAGA